ncbi:F-box protein: endocytic membrane traffic, recycling ReCYcling 1 [Blyttiomyces sp. JEL0837]|nr:F-box protein: endocytic membrane traffic, recycling ReCYcling 1 [Blyttiomyces sp. JEL0837]
MPPRLAAGAAGGGGSGGDANSKSISLAGLPPDLIIRIFTFLPVTELPKVATASRRLKILAYNDDVYKPKLQFLGVISGSDAGDAGPQSEEAEAEAAAVSKLSSKLKQLPGGNMLPGGTKYLETGTLWGGLTDNQPSLMDDPVPSSTNGEGSTAVISAASASSSSALQSGSVGGSGSIAEGGAAAAGGTVSTTTTTDGSVVAASDPSLSLGNPNSGTASPKITAGLPQMKKTNLVVGAGGLKAAGRSTSGISIGGMKRTPKAPGLNGVRARDAFKAIYMELCPYYLDFKGRQKDSKVFKENKDLIEVATLLRRIRLLSKGKFIMDTDDINFSLETTIEWFESMLLGQFERAYDTNNVPEMKRNAMALYELNGGAACVQLFISKNPIFFDHTFNPSLVASMLPSPSAAGVPQVAETQAAREAREAKGYALADEFAKFMDHMLVSCRTQAAMVAKVFNPEMDAMTSFVSKVFEDSITEYLTAVLKTAREGEGVGIYLHTLATAVHCCTQFLDYIQNAEPGVTVHTEKIKESIAVIFKPYTEKYMPMELEFLGKKIDTEVAKWNNRKEKMKKKGGDKSSAGTSAAAGFLTDAEKAQAHKRQVMNTMKAVLYAPMALGKSLAIMGNGILGNNRVRPQNQTLLGDAEEVGNGAGAISPLSHDDSATYQLDDDSLGSLVSLELCLHLMHSNKESLGRTLVITSAVDMGQLRINVGKVFIKLIQAIGDRHMNPAFRSAIDRLSSSTPIDKWSEDNQKAVNMDSLQFFELVHIADLIHQMVDVYFAEDVKPWIDETDFLSDVMVEKKSFDRSSDDNVAHGMDKAIQVLINQVDHILDTTQEPGDFNPPQSKNVFDLKPTKACRDVISCLNAHTRLLNGVTNKDTLEVFFGEVGIRMFNVILKNIKKHQVSQTGAMQLICDLNRYYEWASNLRVTSVAKLFLVLKELGNLFLADGGAELKNLVHDGERYHGALRPEDIYELLASRTDYKKIQKFVESKECLIQ